MFANNSASEDCKAFYDTMKEAFWKIQSTISLSSVLFVLRVLVGQICRFDRDMNTLPIPGCQELSVTGRLDKKIGTDYEKGRIIKSKYVIMEFFPVYLFDNESLHEISNNTAHVLVHFGWIKNEDKGYAATMGIYVKERGKMAKLYLRIIEPLLTHVIYPAFMKKLEKRWQDLLEQKKTLAN